MILITINTYMNKENDEINDITKKIIRKLFYSHSTLNATIPSSVNNEHHTGTPNK